MTPICNLGIVGACCVLLLPLLLPETMSYVKKILLRSISVLMGLCAALVVVIVVGVLVSRRFRSTPAFRDPSGSVVTGSIATLEDMKLGDYQQTLLIRGRNSKNPILLYLHGGPGMTELPLVRHFNAALEERFTVVLWEQRGAGHSYSPFLDKKTLTIEQLLSDAHQLIQNLTERFQQRKVVLVGHSFGSFLGLELARRYPELLSAYVGIGQAVYFPEGEKLSMKFVRREALLSQNAEALRELGRIDDYPSQKPGSMDDVFTERKWLAKFGGVLHGKDGLGSLFSVERPPEFTLFDFVPFALGSYSSLKVLWPQALRAPDFRVTAAKLEVPVYFVMGRHDYNVPFELARDYYDRLDAPSKQWIWFESSAHMPNFGEPEKFNKFMLEQVLPTALAQ